MIWLDRAIAVAIRKEQKELHQELVDNLKKQMLQLFLSLGRNSLFGRNSALPACWIRKRAVAS